MRDCELAVNEGCCWLLLLRVFGLDASTHPPSASSVRQYQSCLLAEPGLGPQCGGGELLLLGAVIHGS